MAARGPDGDTEAIGGGLPAVTLDDLEREPGLGQGEAEPIAQALDPRLDFGLGIADEHDRDRPLWKCPWNGSHRRFRLYRGHENIERQSPRRAPQHNLSTCTGAGPSIDGAR